MVNKRTVWVAFTNTDCTEGRGRDVPIAVCSIEATANRLAKGQYVQGSDGPVRAMELLEIDGKWYAPGAAISIVEPSTKDSATQARIDKRREALEKAKAAGLADEEIISLTVGL